MLFMVVEHFKNGDAVPVYRRFRDEGRMLPEGLKYHSSWIDDDFQICFQLMEADDEKLLEEWFAKWSDLVEFKFYPVMTSADAVRRIESKL